MSRTRSFSGLGRLFLHIDQLEKSGKDGIESPAIVHSFEKPLPLEYAIEGMQNVCRVEKNYKFRSRVDRKKEVLVEIPDFVNTRIRECVREIFLKEENSDEELSREMCRVLNTSFREDLPPWELFIVRNHHKNLMFMKTNHCIGDGYSIGQAMLPFFNEEEQVLKDTVTRFKKVVTLGFKIKFYLWAILSSVVSLFVFVFHYFKTDPKFWKKKLTRNRHIRFLWGKFDVPTIKKIGRSLSPRLTINEFFIALLGETLSEHFSIEKRQTIRMGLPISVRMDPITPGPGNKFGGAIVKIPLGKMTWEERCKRTKAHSRVMKNYPLHYYIYLLAKLFGRWLPAMVIPSLMQQTANGLFTILSTNVSWTEISCTCGKEKIRDENVVAVASLVPGTLFTIAIVGYCKRITIAMQFDEAFHNYESFCDLLVQKYEEFAKDL